MKVAVKAQSLHTAEPAIAWDLLSIGHAEEQAMFQQYQSPAVHC